MRMKTYAADTMEEALGLIKREMGPEAVILNARHLEEPGPLGMYTRKRVEVTAAIDRGETARTVAPSALDEAVRGAIGTYASTGRPSGREVARDRSIKINGAGETVSGPSRVSIANDDVAREIKAIRAGMEELKKSLSNEGGAGRNGGLLDFLTGSGVSGELASRVCGFLEGESAKIGDPTIDPARLKNKMARIIKTAGPIAPGAGETRWIALVGPTGVGKTTTAAKLAAGLALAEGARVALATTDTYRIGAVDQLQIFADIMDVPLHVLRGPEDVMRTRRELAEYKFVLVDTSGRSPLDVNATSEIKWLRHANPAAEAHLVLSAASSREAQNAAIDAFKAAGAAKLIFTKLDETTKRGGILDAYWRAKRPISYVCHGQRVPDDLTAATSALVLDWIFPAKNKITLAANAI